MRPREIRVLQVVNGLAIGGAERKVLDLTSRLDRDRFRVAVCSVGQGGALQPEFERLGVPVHVFRKKFAFDLSLVAKTAQLMREWRPHVVQTTLFYADVVGTMAATISGTGRVISWETVSHGNNDILRTARRHVIAYRCVMKAADRIVAVSQEIRNSLVERRRIDPRKIVVIPYGVDTHKFHPIEDRKALRRELGLPTEAVLVGTVARLEEYKGYLVLLQAAQRLVARHSDLRFVWVGDGSLRPMLESQIAGGDLAERIQILGFRDDVHRLLPAFDLFVLPSLSEGLPNAVLEAMSCGLPCVATRVGGIPEAVCPEETGLLVDPGDVDGLEAAIERYLRDDGERLRAGQKARERVLRYFSVDREVAAFESLYAELAQA